jgi:alcohol dehydrogenase (cytochrome c)
MFSAAPQKYHEGHDFLGSIYVPASGEKTWGAMRALDPFTGEKKWEFKYFSPPWGGALSSAGGVVFAGDSEGNFTAMDARTGKDLWHIQLGAAIYSSPMTYSLDGRQFVVIPAGAALFAFALPAR